MSQAFFEGLILGPALAALQGVSLLPAWQSWPALGVLQVVPQRDAWALHFHSQIITETQDCLGWKRFLKVVVQPLTKHHCNS